LPVVFAIVLASTLSLAPASADTSRATHASRAAVSQGGSFTPLPFLADAVPFGDAGVFGWTNAVSGNHPIVGIARTASSHGYWEAAVDGGVFSFGDARFHGSMGGAHLNQPVVGIAATPTGKGYWLVANDGGVFSFGDARFHGSMGGAHLNQPVVGIAATPTGKGYWLVANDGGVFSFGDARFRGSMGGTPLSQPVVGIAATANGTGYYLVASDGGVFTFGNARFHDAGVALGVPVVGIAVRPQGDGYWLVTASGHVVAFGHAPLLTDASNADITKPIVGIAATRSGKGYWIAGRGTAPVYFLRGEKLGAGTRDVHGGAKVEATVNLVRDLLAGPNAAERAAGLSSAIPAGTALNGISRLGPVANVDLSAQFVSGGGSLSIQERVAQVVFTLTGLPGIHAVSFSINGRHVTTIGGEGLIVDPPVTRSTFDSFRPQVLVVTPAPGDVITSPLVVTGEINSFEGGANFELTAADGRVLAEGIGTGAMGFWLPFASALAFQPAGSAGTLAARPSSGVETRPPPEAVIPVRFAP
jgi:ribosomal protein L24E